jgi:hypothetical protein
MLVEGFEMIAEGFEMLWQRDLRQWWSDQNNVDSKLVLLWNTDIVSFPYLSMTFKTLRILLNHLAITPIVFKLC